MVVMVFIGNKYSLLINWQIVSQNKRVMAPNRKQNAN